MIRMRLWKDIYARWWFKWRCPRCLNMKTTQLSVSETDRVRRTQRKLVMKKLDGAFEFFLTRCVVMQLAYQRSTHHCGWSPWRYDYDLQIHDEIHLCWRRQ